MKNSSESARCGWSLISESFIRLSDIIRAEWKGDSRYNNANYDYARRGEIPSPAPGIGIYRRKPDDSNLTIDATQTTDTESTPSDLIDGMCIWPNW